jgi:hypothetical protein
MTIRPKRKAPPPAPQLPPAVFAVIDQLARTIVARELARRRESPGA